MQSMRIDDLDYFVYINSNRQEWHVWSTGQDNMFRITSGQVNIPETFEVV